MFRSSLRLATMAVRSGAAVRTVATRAAPMARKPMTLLTTGLATATVIAYTQVDQAHCDLKDWLPSFLGGGKPADKYAGIRAEIAKVIEDNAAGPILVRLAWHASGTYDVHSKTGGSNGATMRFPPECKHGANAGLQLARDLLEPIKAKHPGERRQLSFLSF